MMKKLSRLLAMLLALTLCTLPVLGAVAEEATATDAAEETTSPTDVMVTVNGEEILREFVDTIADNLSYSYSQYGYDTTDAEFQKAIEQVAVEYAIQYQLMEQKAVEWGLDQFTDEELADLKATTTENWNNLVDSYITSYGNLKDDATDEEKLAARTSALAALEGMGYTEETMLENAKMEKRYNRVQEKMVEGATVTDEEVQAAFDEKVKEDEASYKDNVSTYEYMVQYYGRTSYYVPEGYRGITHILLDVDDDLLQNYEELSAKLEEQEEATQTDLATSTDAQETPVTQEDVDAAYNAILASVQPTIDEINQKLQEGVPFADLIKEYGNDPGMENEPYASEGYSVHQDSIMWDPAFVKAAFSVEKVGDVAEPVVGQNGVHIVYYLRDVPSGAVELTDTIKEDLRSELLSTKENEAYSNMMNEWIEASTIVYADGFEPLQK